MFDFRKCVRVHLMLILSLLDLRQNHSPETILNSIVVLYFPHDNIAEIHLYDQCKRPHAPSVCHKIFVHFVTAQASRVKVSLADYLHTRVFVWWNVIILFSMCCDILCSSVHAVCGSSVHTKSKSSIHVEDQHVNHILRPSNFWSLRFVVLWRINRCISLRSFFHMFIMQFFVIVFDSSVLEHLLYLTRVPTCFSLRALSFGVSI